jgi:putative transposase
MNEIIALLSYLETSLSHTMMNQLRQIVWGMLCIPNRVTMRGLARWTEKGGSYRTLQRFYQSSMDWTLIHWLFIKKWVLERQGLKLLIADEVVVEKVGQKTHGVGRFYSSKAEGMIPSVSFLAFSVVDVESRESYPVQIVQGLPVVAPPKIVVEKIKRKRGRPKGSKNKKKQVPVLTEHLQQLQASVMNQKPKLDELAIKYLVLDGKYGNYPAIWTVRQTGLHLISKMRHDSALYLDEHKMHKLPKIPDTLPIDTSIQGEYRVAIYQVQAFTKTCPFLLNVVITVKTHLKSGQFTRNIFFSTDLALDAFELLNHYSLRFQIEFNFRDAKQYWGLDQFMNVTPQAVTNAVNLAFLMVNLAKILVQPHRQHDPDFSVIDLKAVYRAHRYLSETIKLLPISPEPNLIAKIRQRLFRLGSIRTRYSNDIAI